MINVGHAVHAGEVLFASVGFLLVTRVMLQGESSIQVLKSCLVPTDSDLYKNNVLPLVSGDPIKQISISPDDAGVLVWGTEDPTILVYEPIGEP